eukprot:GFYU01006669.1.p1 GENE.GFYU01006669.1~~GFYU01006669.1.p1  ORF type:complete len:1129 (-),score=271.98 GFYU01006669.1:286-3672(-)
MSGADAGRPPLPSGAASDANDSIGTQGSTPPTASQPPRLKKQLSVDFDLGHAMSDGTSKYAQSTSSVSTPPMDATQPPVQSPPHDSLDVSSLSNLLGAPPLPRHSPILEAPMSADQQQQPFALPNQRVSTSYRTRGSSSLNTDYSRGSHEIGVGAMSEPGDAHLMREGSGFLPMPGSGNRPTSYRDIEEFLPKTAPGIESISYDDSLTPSGKFLHGIGFRHWSVWVAVTMVGLLAGAIGHGMISLIVALTKPKFELVRGTLATDDLATSFFILVGYTVSIAGVASAMTVYLAPMAQGSGIPEVVGFLNGSGVTGAMKLRTLIVKILALSLAISAGLIVGREGPMVHIGALIAYFVSELGREQRETQGWLYSRFPQLWNHWLKDARAVRDLVSTGVASGISAAFNSPLGGVLYAWEEVSSYWTQRVTWRAFTASMLAALVIQIGRSGFGSTQLNYDSLVVFGDYNFGWALEDLIPFCILGVLGGLTAVGISWIVIALAKYRRGARWRKSALVKVLEVMAVAVMVDLVELTLPAGSGCVELKQDFHIDHGALILDHDDSSHHAREFVMYTCPDGSYNGIATLILQNEEATLKHLLSRDFDVDTFTATDLTATLFFFLTFTILCSSLAIPSGLFVPNMLCGAVIGRLYGLLIKLIIPGAEPGVYALLGASAVLAGYTRMTIALTVILIEVTSDLGLLLPMMLTISIARLTADKLMASADHQQMHLKKIPYLESDTPRCALHLTAKDVMKNCLAVRRVERVPVLLGILRATTASGFPVVADNSFDRLAGFVSRSDIINMIKNEDFLTDDQVRLVKERQAKYIAAMNEKDAAKYGALHSSASGIRVNGNSDSDQKLSMLRSRRSSQTQLLGPAPPPMLKRQTSQGILGMEDMDIDTSTCADRYLDVSSHVDPSPHVIQETLPFHRMYQMIRKLGLRHVIVISRNSGRMVGIVTRKDVLNAVEDELEKGKAEESIVYSPATAPRFEHSESFPRFRKEALDSLNENDTPADQPSGPPRLVRKRSTLYGEDIISPEAAQLLQNTRQGRYETNEEDDVYAEQQAADRMRNFRKSVLGSVFSDATRPSGATNMTRRNSNESTATNTYSRHPMDGNTATDISDGDSSDTPSTVSEDDRR